MGNVVARNDRLAFPQVGQNRKNVVPNYGIPVFKVVDDEDSRLTTRSLGTWLWQCWCASPCSCRWLRHACNSCSRERGLSFFACGLRGIMLELWTGLFTVSTFGFKGVSVIAARTGCAAPVFVKVSTKTELAHGTSVLPLRSLGPRSSNC